MSESTLRRARSIAADVVLLAGACAVTVGAREIHPAAGWIVGGCLAVAAGILMGWED